ncbi:MAG: SPOR domain-containing protein [Bacteroidota bacterium]
MKNICLLVVCLFFIFSFNENIESQEKKEPNITKVDDSKYPYGFYMINVSASASVNEAVQQVQELQKKGHPAGYLWLPDYKSLSDKELYAVFIGPFMGRDTCIKYLNYYQKEEPKAYAVKAEHSKRRVTIHNKFDIRVNGKKQFMILTYATPEDSKEYAKGGGEDWAWFVNDVATYFDKYHADNVFFGRVYYSWLNKKDIAKLVEELELEDFGYVLIKGKEKSFTPHDMPDGVISEACDFFGFEMNKNWQEEMNN